MAKKIKAVVKLQIQAGKANPAPPVGSVLGQHGVNIMGFCKEYNERTSSQAGMIIPAHITIYEDRTFSFITKQPPTADLLRKAIDIEKGTGNSGREIVGKISREKLREVAESKAKDLNATTIEMAEKIVAGTARSMGIEVE